MNLLRRPPVSRSSPPAWRPCAARRLRSDRTDCIRSNTPVSQPTYGAQSSSQVEYGRVESVDVVQAENQTSGAGAALGGVLGAVVGRQIGGGSGRDAATVVGAVGGAIVGNQIEKNRSGASDFVRVTVRLDGGGTRQFDYEPGVRRPPGDRVYIQGDQLMRY